MEIYHERGDDVDWICWSGGVRRSVTVLGNERFAVCSTLCSRQLQKILKAWWLEVDQELLVGLCEPCLQVMCGG